MSYTRFGIHIFFFPGSNFFFVDVENTASTSALIFSNNLCLSTFGELKLVQQLVENTQIFVSS